MPKEQGKKVTLLDCTLRDGGYFTNWQFEKKLALSLISSLNKAGIDIIEVGYKSPSSHKISGFEGLFRFCTESQLTFLRHQKPAEYSFMVDAKEFLDGDRVDESAVSETIPHRDESLFGWVRVATYYPNMQGCSRLVPALKDLGYNVTLNLMGTSLLSEEEFCTAMAVVGNLPLDVFYFSDSFGDLVPADIGRCISLIRNYYKGKIGIHTHDSNGLAFANTLEAIRLGVDFVDSTVLGMGRGAGNLRTEQILLYLYFKEHYSHLNPSELLEVIDSYFLPLQKKHAWGWDFTYMLSALQNIHPTYCMNLRASSQYTIEQVSNILNSIEISKRSTFNETSLMKAIDSAINAPVDAEENLVDLPRYRPVKGEEFLVIATGPSLIQFREELAEFIRQKKPVVFECNPPGDNFESVSATYYRAILNWVRLKKTLDTTKKTSAPIVTGMGGIPREYAGLSEIVNYPCHVSRDQVIVGNDGLIVPAYDVGMFAVGLALLSSPKTIYLAGFDGFEQANPKQEKMNVFWNAIDPKTTRMVSLTPTTYPLAINPIYRFIQ